MSEISTYVISPRTYVEQVGSDFLFSCCKDGGYVYVCIDYGPKRQICEGGGFVGNTLMANENNLYKIAQRWYKSYRKDIIENM